MGPSVKVKNTILPWPTRTPHVGSDNTSGASTTLVDAVPAHRLAVEMHLSKKLTFSHNFSGGPAARLKRGRSARAPRAPARGFAPCTPSYDRMSEKTLTITIKWCTVMFV